MAALEMRIDRLNFDTTADYSHIQSFSIGHESCIVKFFKIIRHTNLLNFVNEQKKNEKPIRIITPFVPEKHLDSMKFTMEKICRQKCFENSTIIVNDFGLMNYIFKIDPKRQMCLGRSLSVCFDYAPWGHKIYENESSQIQDVASQISFYDDEKMEFYSRYNITEIEANFTKNTIESLKNIQKAGFKVNVHQSTFLYGIQRSCYIKRYHVKQTCTGTECEYARRIELDSLWDNTGFFEASENIEFPSPLYLRGNQIYGKAYNIPCDWADRIIVDSE